MTIDIKIQRKVIYCQTVSFAIEKYTITWSSLPLSVTVSVLRFEMPRGVLCVVEKDTDTLKPTKKTTNKRPTFDLHWKLSEKEITKEKPIIWWERRRRKSKEILIGHFLIHKHLVYSNLPGLSDLIER